MKFWYLIHSKPKSEQLAKNNLERQGYETYLPLVQGKTKRRGKTTKLIQAMFPRYLFIRLDEQTDDWGPIASTIGVSKLVRFGQTPGRIPDSLIFELRNHENEKGLQSEPVIEFKEGDRVRITDGPFEGYEGLFEAHSSKDRVLILLKIIEKNISIKVKSDIIERG
jgi:transcriptional antiterminator RfaH